jgi:hypothetical protein
MRWVIVAIAGIASAGLIAVSVAMNFAFGSSFGRTPLESYVYGAAFGFADILKVAAPFVVARSYNHKWGAAILGLLVWGTFTVSSAVSTIGFASANRTFAIDARTVQAALNQSRLVSLETDQSELRRLRDRLASPEVGRGERIQLSAAAQRLEAAIAASRGKLEDAAPVVSTANPQAYTLAKLIGAGIDKIEVGLVLLVALLVEMGGLGPFITMNLAKVPQSAKVPLAPKVPKTAKVPEGSAPQKASRKQPQELGRGSTPLSSEPQRPSLIYSAVAPPAITLDLERFLDRHAHHGGGSVVGSSEVLARYNRSRRERGLPEISQRRLGDAMRSLGYHNKPRIADGRIHYQGLAWVQADARELHEVTAKDIRASPATSQTPPRHKNGAARVGTSCAPSW